MEREMTEVKDLAKNPAALDSWPPLPRLVEIGLYAAHSGKVSQALALFEGLLQAAPGLVRGRLGLAFSRLVVNEFDQAEAGLRAVLAESPDHPEAKAVLGLTLALSGRLDEAAGLLKGLGESGGPAAELARQLLS
jgi:tetratricopeptide (TPR) repeat protein